MAAYADHDVTQSLVLEDIGDLLHDTISNLRRDSKFVEVRDTIVALGCLQVRCWKLLETGMSEGSCCESLWTALQSLLTFMIVQCTMLPLVRIQGGYLLIVQQDPTPRYPAVSTASWVLNMFRRIERRGLAGRATPPISLSAKRS